MLIPFKSERIELMVPSCATINIDFLNLTNLDDPRTPLLGFSFVLAIRHLWEYSYYFRLRLGLDIRYSACPLDPRNSFRESFYIFNLACITYLLATIVAVLDALPVSLHTILSILIP